MITDVDADVVNTASRIYPLVFRCVSSTNAVAFYEYLRDEVNVIEKGGLEAAGDPHVANLNRDQAESECLFYSFSRNGVSTVEYSRILCG